MRAGKLTQRIQIERPVRQLDPATQQDLQSWVRFGAPVAAEIEQVRGSETNVQGQVVATRDYSVSIRRSSRDGLTETMRLLWLDSRGRTQSILHVVAIGFDPKRRMVQFTCKS